MGKKASLFETLEITIEALLGDPGVDAVLCILDASNLSVVNAYCQVVEKATVTHPDKPVVFYFYGASLAAKGKGVLEEGGKSMVFPSPNRAIRALAHLADYSEFRTNSGACEFY